MTRDFYFFGKAFLGLSAFCALLQAILFFFVGSGVHGVNSFPAWFLVATFVNVASSLYILKYFFHKGYLGPFVAAIVVVISALFHAVVVFSINLLMDYYLPAAYMVTGSGTIYAFALLLSDARKRVWLKWVGLVLLAASTLYIVIFVLMWDSPRMLTDGFVLKISQWASLITTLIPVGYIMNFREEEKSLHDDNAIVSSSKIGDSLLAVGFLIALIGSGFFGFRLVTEGMRQGVVTLQARKMSQQFKARTYIGAAGESMSYRLLKPLDYDSTQKYPLAVCLHGGAGWGTDNIKQFDGSLEAQILYTPENRKKYPAFLFVPQCPPGTSWGGVPGLRNVDSLVFEIIHSLEQEFSIDTHRRYVMGHSLGGYGAWYFIGTRPEMFAAAIPSAGFGDSSFGKLIADVPVWAFHGRLDRKVSMNGSRDIIEAMRQAGGNPKYTEYPEIGHGTWDSMKNNPELMDWLFAQRRE